MFAAQLGGSHDAGPVVGKGGNWDGFLEEVRSHEMEHGGVKMVVRAARGAVMVRDMLTGGEPSTDGSSTTSTTELGSTQLITPGGGSYERFVSRLRATEIDGSGKQDQDEGRRAILLTGQPGDQASRRPPHWHRGRFKLVQQPKISLDPSPLPPSPHMMA